MWVCSSLWLDSALIQSRPLRGFAPQHVLPHSRYIMTGKAIRTGDDCVYSGVAFLYSYKNSGCENPFWVFTATSASCFNCKYEPNNSGRLWFLRLRQRIPILPPSARIFGRRKRIIPPRLTSVLIGHFLCVPGNASVFSFLSVRSCMTVYISELQRRSYQDGTQTDMIKRVTS